MPDVVKIDELEFVKLIEAREIARRNEVLASQLNSAIGDKNPLFVVVLNGAFIFAADLLRHFEQECDIIFVDAKSYEGIKPNEDIEVVAKSIQKVKDRLVVIVEDIVDTGHTIKVIKSICEENGAQEIKTVSFLSKPSAIKHDISVDYVGFEISQLFVIGYGLDYKNKGRNLRDIYQIRPIIK